MQAWADANLGVVQATFAALQATYDFLTPDLWQETRFEKNPLQEFTDFLAKPVRTMIAAMCAVCGSAQLYRAESVGLLHTLRCLLSLPMDMPL